MTIDETFDVGVDTRTPVDDKDYQVPFRFTGKIDKLTFKLGPEQLAAEDQKAKADAMARVQLGEGVDAEHGLGSDSARNTASD